MNTEPPAPKNDDLYRAGKRYAALSSRLTSKGRRTTWRAIAAEFGPDRTSVVNAVRFADAVDRIAGNCGTRVKSLLLSDHPRLPARVVVQIGRTHADRQRHALAQVGAGRNPFGKPPAGVLPPFGTHGYPEVLSRLARNAGLLDHVADGLLATPACDWPDRASLDDAGRDIRLVLAGCRSMTALMKRAGGRLGGWDARTLTRHPPPPFNPSAARPKVASVRGITAKNTRELPRVVRESPPTRATADAVLGRVRALRRSAERLAAVIRARGHDPRTGPPAVPGTYVVFFTLAAAATGHRIGSLGTFDFPAGVYAYLGSAFGGGGVRKRAHRHLTRRSKERWNIDWLKPLCTPVAVWWTHDRRKVEFDWARILASLPGASFPAPAFGAADNRAAKAHLVRFDRVPSFTLFRQRATAAGHSQVHRKRIESWAGRGWPNGVARHSSPPGVSVEG